MDFLDPRKKRTHRIRLLIGYGLMTMVIGFSTYLLTQAADGFGINTKTGEIVQNGLLFVDSKPGGAKIYLNGVDQDRKTASRLILQSGDYQLTLQKDGYRQWQRSFHLAEHKVSRYAYPLLFPVEPQVSDVKHYPALPPLVSQSPSRRWLMIQREISARRLTFDLYDTGDLERSASSLFVSTNLFNGLGSSASMLKAVSWSSDNNYLLLEHRYDTGKEFVVVNRSQPARSFNVSRLFNIAPDKVVFRDGRIDQLYLLTAGSLQVGDTRNGELQRSFLSNVLDFKSYGQRLISYVTTTGAPAGRMSVRILDGDRPYTLTSLAPADTYILDAAAFDGSWYYIVGSTASDQLNIYKDPLNALRKGPSSSASPILALRQPGMTSAGFSDNSRIIGAQAGQKFSTYDIETKETHQFKVTPTLGDRLDFFDGHHWIGQAGGNIYVVDHDGSNAQQLGPSLLPSGGFFSPDLNHLLTFHPRTAGGSVTLVDIDMRAGEDLPTRP
jgi:hypothetical protein